MNPLHVDHVHRVDVMTSGGRLFAERERIAMALWITGEQRERIDVNQLEA